LSVVRGTVINIHYHGATVRLEDGRLASVTAFELAEHRATYVASLQRRAPLALELDERGRHPCVALHRDASAPPAEPDAPQLTDEAFEERMDRYLKSTEEWAPPDRPPPAERHFIRKKRRARIFEARNTST
jgi:hypothetical protein